MEALWPRSVPALLILVAAAPWVASVREATLDQDQAHRHQAHRDQAAAHTSIEGIKWDDLATEISGSGSFLGEFHSGDYMGKVSSSYAWKTKTIMFLGQQTLGNGMPVSLRCVIKVPCVEVWTHDNTHQTKQLYLRQKSPLFNVDGGWEESYTHSLWRRSEDLIVWAKNDCDKAQYLFNQGQAVVQCLYSSIRDDGTMNKKKTMFNVFQEYVPARQAWNDFVPGKTAKQIAQAFYSIMQSSLTAVRDLHKLGMIHHFLTLDSIALQFDHPQQDGEPWEVSVKLTNFEHTTSAEQEGIKQFEEALNSFTWDVYSGSPPETMADHMSNPEGYDVFMLGCAFVYMLTGSALQDIMFFMLQYQYTQTKAPPEWEHLFLDKDGGYQHQNHEWKSAYIGEAFRTWVKHHSTTANGPKRSDNVGIKTKEFGPLTQGELHNPVYFDSRTKRDFWSSAPWYRTVEPFVAPVLDNVRTVHAQTLKEHAEFNKHVLDITTKMLSFMPEDRMSAVEILDSEMGKLQEVLDKIQ
eukprot:CAMPEP_0168378022 /NCGR_PEP_ID=MMETSP0228-20121227/11126_1 /TAXON_ID=133427 /ORGANISM="Protoceratium reticulatum, Strain CCCM 535 (=CCMP 1889)" /LENGTH=520 /DNA_ID=CAMNT_0008391035 /DNA_START=63 /DNA_END=1625 /DNA_ORIENTATION=-